jgi:16S rRNA (adenine(1408)-N(1))-methyltransferase
LECIRGKRSYELDRDDFCLSVDRYQRVHIDLGTGDGRYATYLAAQHPEWLIIGLDACRDNVRMASRRAPANLLFVIANALELPGELTDIAHSASLLFPWGSLLNALLTEPVDGCRLRALLRQCEVEVVLNAGAVAEEGWGLQDTADQVSFRLRESGRTVTVTELDLAHMRTIPSTWAKRIAFGRDPQALRIEAAFAATEIPAPPAVGRGSGVFPGC